MSQFKIIDIVTGVATAVGLTAGPETGTPAPVRYRKGNIRNRASEPRRFASALPIARSHRDIESNSFERSPAISAAAETTVDQQDLVGISGRGGLIVRWRTDHDGALVMIWTCEES
jgi:hypothetical protein